MYPCLGTNTRHDTFQSYCARTIRHYMQANPLQCLPTGIPGLIVTRLMVMVSKIARCVAGLVETEYRAHLELVSQELLLGIRSAWLLAHILLPA